MNTGIYALGSIFGQGGGTGGFMIVYLIIMMGLLWFVSTRSQKKEQKRMKDLLSSLSVGDSILTNSGFYGVVIDISEEIVIVEFGSNKNCRIPMKKECIASIEHAE